MKLPGHVTDIEALFDLSPDLLCFIDSKGYFIKVNKAFQDALGYTKKELLSTPFINFVDPDNWQATNQQITALARDKSVSQFENRYHCLDGSYKWFSWNAFQLPDKTCFASARDITLYKVALETSAKATSDNQLIFNRSLDVLCMLDKTGRFTKVNEASLMLWGYEEKELIGKLCSDLVHPDDLEKSRHIRSEIRNGNNQSNFENRILCKNGAYLPVIWSLTWLPGEQLMFAIARDATESEKQKEQLRLKEHRLISLIESGNDIILILNAEGVYKFVSPSVKTILNSDPEYYLGKVTFQFIHPDDLEWVGAEFQAVLETEKPVYIAPFRFQMVSGDWAWIETIATNRLNDPAIAGIVINAKNVTSKINEEQDKRIISEQLSLTNERYRLVIEATKDVIWDWNLETQRLTRDISFEKLLGYTATQETDTSNGAWEDYIFPEDKDRVIKSIKEAIADPEKKYWHEDYRFLKADHTIAFISDHGYIIRNLDQKAVRMVGAMHDRTEGREKEQKILRQNKQLTEVALINSHQLRRPVATILGLVELLDKSVFDEENREIIEHLETTAAELDSAIRRINSQINLNEKH
ncbi:MAG: PAS domain S-box protein [Pedobacter sp.]